MVSVGLEARIATPVEVEAYRRRHVTELDLTDFMKHLFATAASQGYAIPQDIETWQKILKDISPDPARQQFLGKVGDADEVAISNSISSLQVDGYFSGIATNPEMLKHQFRNLQLYTEDYRVFLRRAARLAEARGRARRV